MVPHAVSCPQCQTALRSQRPLSPGVMVRCPQCSHHFLATLAPAVCPAAPPNASRPLLLLLIPAALAALLLGAGVIVGTYVFVRPPPTPLPLAEEDQRQQVNKFCDQGQKHLTDKDGDDAKSLNELLREKPNDSKATKAIQLAQKRKRQ